MAFNITAGSAASWGAGRLPPRVLGDVHGTAAGPSLVVVGGLHGNEPAGALAAARVALELEGLRPSLRGRAVFLAGNRQALAVGQRFIRRDLNRIWSRAQLERLAHLTLRDLGDEEQEQVELARTLREIERAQRGPLILIDLHTTSAPSAPCVCFGDTLRNRRLALALPTTAILGLEEVIEGALVGYCTDRGHVGISIESGQHRDPEAVERHVAAIWLLLVAAGCLPAAAVPALRQHRERLARASGGRPRVVEVRYRHAVVPGDGFELLPGFESFAPIAAGQVVGSHRQGPLRAPEAGLMLMPRYQAQGEDGYFLVREVRPVWLKLSGWLRRAGVPRVLPYLPGVERDRAAPGQLVVDPRVAFAHVADVMHLCGYRRRRSPESKPVFARRGTQRM
jgi:succinylglutamate desuccinylase